MKHDEVKEYYGETLQSSADLQTNACCTAGEVPDYLKSVLSKIHNDVMEKYYGCGLIAPQDLRGLRILDLGCGSGRDVYALSALVGENGFVVGVDMTTSQLDVARAHQDYHADAFGYEKPNTQFYQGLIEELDKLPLEPASFDIIVSNCVLNLALDKGAVLRGVHRLLKPGGEMYFSDVYADRRIPEALQKDEILYGECLSGALYWNDFEHMAKASGFQDPRLVEDRVLTVENPALQEKLGRIGFRSATYRLWKIDGLEPACQDYGQAVIYAGSMAGASHGFILDKHHNFETGKVFSVCANTYRMLQETRFARHFQFIGDWTTHYGLFEDCAAKVPFVAIIEDSAGDTDRDSGASCC